MSISAGIESYNLLSTVQRPGSTTLNYGTQFPDLVCRSLTSTSTGTSFTCAGDILMLAQSGSNTILSLDADTAAGRVIAINFNANGELVGSLAHTATAVSYTPFVPAITRFIFVDCGTRVDAEYGYTSTAPPIVAGGPAGVPITITNNNAICRNQYTIGATVVNGVIGLRWNNTLILGTTAVVRITKFNDTAAGISTWVVDGNMAVAAGSVTFDVQLLSLGTGGNSVLDLLCEIVFAG